MEILSVPVASEHIDVWSESSSELEEEIFEEQSKNVIFAFEPVACLGEADISRFPQQTQTEVPTTKR